MKHCKQCGCEEEEHGGVDLVDGAVVTVCTGCGQECEGDDFEDDDNVAAIEGKLDEGV